MEHTENVAIRGDEGTAIRQQAVLILQHAFKVPLQRLHLHLLFLCQNDLLVHDFFLFLLRLLNLLRCLQHLLLVLIHLVIVVIALIYQATIDLNPLIVMLLAVVLKR